MKKVITGECRSHAALPDVAQPLPYQKSLAVLSFSAQLTLVLCALVYALPYELYSNVSVPLDLRWWLVQ